MRQQLWLSLIILAALTGSCAALGGRRPAEAQPGPTRTHLPMLAGGAPPTPRPTETPGPPATPESGRRPWSAVRSWVYWLDSPDLAQIRASGYQLAVIDYARNGDSAGRFTAEEIASLRDDTCRRRVLAYLSIGQAESYRSYWQDDWQPGSPAWLVAEDPDWPTNYFVHYWDPGWQAIVFAYLDEILAAGFDGVYLDRVDAYTQPYAAGREADMKSFVAAIAAYGRARSPLGEDFGVFPQNAEGLALDPVYVTVTTGIGVEELYYRAMGEPVPEIERLAREDLLGRFRDGSRGGLVLTVDYTSQSDQVEEAYLRSARRGFVPYVTDPALDGIAAHPGHEPACEP